MKTSNFRHKVFCMAYELMKATGIIRKTTRTNFQNEAVRYFYSLPKRSGSFWYKLQGTVSKLPCPCA